MGMTALGSLPMEGVHNHVTTSPTPGPAYNMVAAAGTFSSSQGIIPCRQFVLYHTIKLLILIMVKSQRRENYYKEDTCNERLTSLNLLVLQKVLHCHNTVLRFRNDTPKIFRYEAYAMKPIFRTPLLGGFP